MISLARSDLAEALRRAGLRLESDTTRPERSLFRRGALIVEAVGDPVSELTVVAPPSRDLGALAATLCGLLCGEDARGLLPRMARDLDAYSERGALLGRPFRKAYAQGESRLEIARIGPLMAVTLRPRR